MLTFQWHGDTFSLPSGSVLLASSPAFPHQAFRWGARAYGVQFHLEVSLDMAREWLQVPEYAKSLNDSLGPGSAATLIDSSASARNGCAGRDGGCSNGGWTFANCTRFAADPGWTLRSDALRIGKLIFGVPPFRGGSSEDGARSCAEHAQFWATHPIGWTELATLRASVTARI
jgi:hypothetical protein